MLRVYTVFLGLQFIYTWTYMRTRLGVYITDMHVCLCKLLCTRLVCTWVLCTKASISSIMCAHACIYTREMKTCHVEYMMQACLVKFKLCCTTTVYCWRSGLVTLHVTVYCWGYGLVTLQVIVHCWRSGLVTLHVTVYCWGSGIVTLHVTELLKIWLVTLHVTVYCWRSELDKLHVTAHCWLWSRNRSHWPVNVRRYDALHMYSCTW